MFCLLVPLFISCFTTFPCVRTEPSLTQTVKQLDFFFDRLENDFNTNTLYKKIEEEYSRPDFSFQRWPFQSLVRELAESVEEKLSRVVRSLSDLRTKAQQLYKVVLPADVNYTPTIQYNTQNRNLKASYSSLHEQNVSFKDTFCIVPSDVWINETQVKKDVIWTESLVDTFGDNFRRDPELLVWQYYCSEFGVMRLYPAPPDTLQGRTTRDYDCRYQQWYLEGDGCPKDIVIAFDLSGSMVGWPLKMAQETAYKIVNLLSDNDFLGFIGISGEPLYIGDQQNQSIKLLERATDRTKWLITKLIEEVVPYDEANFESGVEAAFDMFDESAALGRTASCQKILIVFSDGTIQNCKEIFERRNPNKSVQVFSFACGKPRTTVRGLQEMACNNRGNFLTVGELTDVNSKTFEFFKQVNKNSNSGRKVFSPKWSNTYVEEPFASHVLSRTSAWEEEKVRAPRQMILSVSAATFYQDTKTGVVGLDIKVENLISKLVSLNKVGMYVVLVNNRGNVVYHPRLRPLADLDFSYVARFAELEQCSGGVTSADIERAAISGEDGMIEARCLYHFSINNQRGREVFTTLQFYYTSLAEYPFYLILVIPTFFSHQIQALQDLTEDRAKVVELLEAESRTRKERESKARALAVGWFTKAAPNSYPREQLRYEAYVVNETLEHYSVVHSSTYRVWTEEHPVMLYAIPGLTLYSYSGWLDDGRNSEEFTKNPRLVANIEEQTSDLNFGPLVPSIMDHRKKTMFLTRNIIINTPDNSTVSPAIVGMELQEASMKTVLDILKGPSDSDKEAWASTDTILVDDKGFVVYEDPQKPPDQSVIGSHISTSYPELTADLLRPYFNTNTQQFERAFTLDTFTDCLAVCSTKTEVSSSGRLSSLMASLYSLMALSSAHSQLGSNRLRGVRAEQPTHRCCSDYQIFRLNRAAAPKEIRIQCGDCTRVFLTTPVPRTNLLLIRDLSPDCMCGSATHGGDMLRAFNTSDVYSVAFGAESYAPLECTNNVNISTPCSNTASARPAALAFTLLSLLLLVL